MLNRVVIICTGNICRSPMAEILFRQKLAGSKVDCVSAGTHAMVGHPADENVREVMTAHGLDASSHRSQQATSQLNWADLILALDQTHVDWLNGVTLKAPHLRGRVFKLGKWNGNADVEDPYRKPRSAFERAYLEIDKYVDKWVEAMGGAPTAKSGRG